METFSALLAICARNSPVPGEFPAQRPVTRSFDVLFDLRPNKCLSKQSLCWWFETPSGSLWRHCNGAICNSTVTQVTVSLQTCWKIRWGHFAAICNWSILMNDVSGCMDILYLNVFIKWIFEHCDTFHFKTTIWFSDPFPHILLGTLL